MTDNILYLLVEHKAIGHTGDGNKDNRLVTHYSLHRSQELAEEAVANGEWEAGDVYFIYPLPLNDMLDHAGRTSFMTKDWCLAMAEQESHAPTPGDANGERNLQLDDLLGDLLTACVDGDDAAVVRKQDEIQRLYRAATGEVVGTATVELVGSGPDGDLVSVECETDDDVHLTVGETFVLLRRDKEGA